MIDVAGDVARYGDQAAFLAEDFEKVRGGRDTRCATTTGPEGLSEFKHMAVPYRSFFAAAHHQFRTVGKKSL